MRLALLLAIGLLIGVSFAASPSKPDAVSSTVDCHVDGNADLYGIGIRLGFYMQTCGLFINLYLKRKEVDHVDANTIWFHIASLTALLYNWVHGTIYVGEVFIVSNLLWMLVWAEVYLVSLFAITSAGPKSFKKVDDFFESRSESKIDEILQAMFKKSLPLILASMLQCTMYFFYLTPFWWHGINHLHRAPCGDKAFFFFTKVDMDGWFRSLEKTWLTMGTVGGGSM